MSDVTFKIVGIDKVSDNIRQLAEFFPRQAAEALNAVAEATMTDAKEHTPVEFGTLKRSGHVRHARPERLEATLSFGTEYAVYVHERTELRHHVGEAKFLERAVQRTAQGFDQRIADYMGRARSATGAGGGGRGGQLL